MVWSKAHAASGRTDDGPWPTEHPRLRCLRCGGALPDYAADTADRTNAVARCVCGASYGVSAEGVLRLATDDFLDNLLPFTAAVTQFRADRGFGQLPLRLLTQLPDAMELRRDPAWRQRRADLTVMAQIVPGLAAQRSPSSPRARLSGARARLSGALDRSASRTTLLPHRPLRILEIGAWNHWLTAHLAGPSTPQLRHRVTAVDTFAGRVDGLGARHVYDQPRWRSVQIDVRDLSVLGRGWDLIIINRCVQFSADPIAWLQQLPKLLAADGVVVLLGMAFFRRPQQKIAAIAQLDDAFRAATGRGLFLHPCRGWLGPKDAEDMTQLGIKLWPYANPRLLAAEARALVQPARPFHRWGWWRPRHTGAHAAARSDST